jgi:hypothetical protein
MQGFHTPPGDAHLDLTVRSTAFWNAYYTFTLP